MSDTNFNIGATIKINTNRASSSFTHTAVIKFNGSTVRTQKNIGASYSWNTTELYKYITKANKATGTVTLTTYSGSTQIGTSSVNFTANVTNSNPTFSNCVYEDTGSVSTQLTGNNQILINGYNVLKVTISTANKAVAKNSATMSKYRLVCGNKSVEASYSSTADVTLSLSYVTDRTFVVYAIDSRGNTTAVTKSAEEWKDYSAIAIKSGSVARTGGVQQETTLIFEGEFWKTEELLDFGAVANEITTCQYKYKKSNESEYSEPIDITPTISENKFNFNETIKGDAGAEGFDLSYSYNIQITISDKIKTATYNILLGTGVPLMAVHPKGVAFGQPYNESIGGSIQSAGTIHTPTNKYFPNCGLDLHNSDVFNANSIFMSDESTGYEGINFLRTGGDKTNLSSYECLRGLDGKLYYAGISMRQNNICTVYRSADLANRTKNDYVAFTSNVRVGNKLAAKAAGIIIGTGVSKVLVSGACFIDTPLTGGYIWLGIRKNTQEAAKVLAGEGSTFKSASISPRLLSVAEGDVIRMYIDNTGGTPYKIRGTVNTWLTVEVVE